MTARLLPSAAFVLAALALAAPAQTEAPPAADAAAGFFNRSAALFCRDRIDDARAVVTSGLEQFPDDGPLQRLRALLEQPTEGSSSNESGSESSNQQNHEAGEGEPPPEDEPKPEPGEGDPEPSDPGGGEDAPPPKPGESGPAAGELSPDQLARLLEAAAEEEMKLREVLRRTLPQTLPVDKDW
jgi:hypothetical protein